MALVRANLIYGINLKKVLKMVLDNLITGNGRGWKEQANIGFGRRIVVYFRTWPLALVLQAVHLVLAWTPFVFIVDFILCLLLVVEVVICLLYTSPSPRD